MPKIARLAGRPLCQISCDVKGVSVSLQKRMDTRPMLCNRKRLRRYIGLSVCVLAIVVGIPNHNIDPDDVAFDIQALYSETFQEYKKRMDYEKQIQATHKAMIRAIAGYKEKKRLKRNKKCGSMFIF